MASDPWEEHFASPAEQAHAAQLGMWVFVASEILLFGALFATYAFYRTTWGSTFREAIHDENIWLGGAMTWILLTASLFVALAEQASRRGHGKRTAAHLLVAVLLACGFLLIHIFEYIDHSNKGELPGIWYSSQKLTDRGASMFYSLFWVMTGLHFVHVAIGAVALAIVAVRALQGRYTSDYHIPVEITGMYWQLVDTVWMFLFPIFYCAR
jgi:cytochrome c oxidase subunit 3